METLCVDLVDVFCTGGPGRKPAAGGYHFQTADRRVIPRGAGQPRNDRLTGEARFRDSVVREFLEPRLLLRRGSRINARVVGPAKLGRQLAIVLAWILSGTGGNLGCEQ